MMASYLDLVQRTLRLTPEPLTVRQLAVILYVGQHGARTFTEVREDLALSAPALTRAADALMSAALLRRTPSADKRVPLLSLTPNGVQVAMALSAGDSPVPPVVLDGQEGVSARDD